MAPTHEARARATQRLGGRRSKMAVGSLSLFGLLLTVGLLAPVQSAEAAPARERYVVKTSSGVSNAKATVKAERVGRVEHEFSHVMHGFTAKLTPTEAADLRNDPGVEAVVPDMAYQLDDQVHKEAVQNGPTWGLDRIDNQLQPAPDQPALDGKYDYSNTGAGVTVFVVDTGINFTHQEFGGRATSGWDFTGDDVDDPFDDDPDASDCDGHGTHVAGTIGGSTYGVAKGVRLKAVRVLDCNGDGWVSDMLAGLDWVYANRPAGPAVVNMSVGFSASSSLTGFVQAAINKLATVRIPVVVAAGNEGSNACNFGPALTPKAITVGADSIYATSLDNHGYLVVGGLLPYDTRAVFSNTGTCLDLYAPGVEVTSSYVGSNTATDVLSGTSMASPHVAGAVARLLQDNPLASVDTVTAQLLNQTTNNALNDAGGAPNKLLHLTPGSELPGAPTAQSVTVNNASKTATVNWQPPSSDGGSPITGYRVIRTGSYDANRQVVAVANLTASARTYAFSKLLAGGSYSIRVVPITAKGTGAAEAQSARMMALPGKTRIGTASSGTKKGKGITVTGRWAKPTSGGPISYYQVKADRQSSSKDKIVTVRGSVTSVQISGLAKKKKYRIYVRALNTAGVGAWSSASNKVTAK